MNTTAKVRLWGRDIGAVTWLDEQSLGVFQYQPDFAKSNIQVAPLTMPLDESPYQFPALARNSFHGSKTSSASAPPPASKKPRLKNACKKSPKPSATGPDTPERQRYPTRTANASRAPFAWTSTPRLNGNPGS